MLSGAARLAGVVGWPVAHSRSPRIHGYWLEEKGIDGAYLPLAVRPDALAAALGALPALGFRGCNLTAPHKEAALARMDTLSETARRIGAVNTVTVGDDGALHGDNTDGFGFISHLRQEAAGWNSALPVAVLGAGGAARAVLDALVAAGVPQIRLLNRTGERAAALAVEAGETARPMPWDQRAEALADCGLLVNTTNLGQVGKPALDLTLDRLPPDAVVYDLVYAPLETDLLKAARERDHATVDGLGMLIHQARPGFAAWFGAEAEATAALRTFAAEGL
ncbi:MAG: shikimate dehydrogenase [Rhodospirillales bacterium]|nr:shikimate dehydrogenase [Rhodospirillales bacterium]